VRCLRDDESLDPSGMRVVVLGAGGAARAVAVELALAGVEQVTIINRTLSAAESVADAVRATGHAEATALGWVGEATIPGGTDLVVVPRDVVNALGWG
jgi:shikimate dehydrogenase